MRLRDVVRRPGFSEGWLGSAIEERTARLPTDTFLWAALGCIVGSVVLQAAKRKTEASLVGQLAPVLLVLGIYNKVVRRLGRD